MTARGSRFALFGAAVVATAWWGVASQDARAGTPVQLTVAAAAAPGDLTVDGRTYADVAADVDLLGAGDAVRLAAAVPGLDALGPVSTEVEHDPASRTVVFDAVAGSLPADATAVGATSLALIVDWTDDTDTTPTVAVVLLDTTASTISDLEPRWTGDDTPVEDVRLVLAPAAGTIDADGLSAAASGLLGLSPGDALDLLAGATVRATYGGGVAAIDDVLDDVGADAGAAVSGPLTDDVTHLLAGGDPQGDPAVFAPAVVGTVSSTPAWLDERTVSVTHTLAPDPVLTRTDTVVVEGTTFTGTLVLGDEGAELTLTADQFTPPFGLDALLGGLTFGNVELTLTSGEGGALGGAVAFDLPIGDGVRVSMSLEDDGDRVAGTLAVDDQVGLGELLAWLGARPGFEGLDPGASTADLDRLQLTTAELTFVADASATTFTVFADASLALAGDPVGFEVLASVRVPTEPGASPEVLVALRSADGTLLGDVVPVPEPAAGLQLPRLTLLLALPDTFTAPPSDLGPRAEAFLADVLGDDLTDPLELGPGVLLRAEVAVASLGDEVAGALGWDPEGTIVLQGELGIDVGALLTQSPPPGEAPPGTEPPAPAPSALRSVALSATIPNGGAPTWLPDFLAWPDGGEWSLALEYERGEEGAGAAFSFTAGLAGAEITLPGDDSPLALDLSAAFTKDDAGLTVALSGAIGDWVAPYGVEWLTIDEAALDVTITKPATPPAEPGQAPPPAPPLEVSVGFAGAVTVDDVGLEVGIDVASGAEGVDATIRIALLDAVTIADLTDLLGIDLGEYQDLVGSLGFGPGELVVTVGGGAWQVEAAVSLQWDPYGAGDPLTARVLLGVAKPAPVEGVAQPLRVVFGIQPEGDVTLGSFLPPEIDVPIEIPLAGADDPATEDVDESFTFGFVYTNAAFDPADLPDDSLTGAWFQPLFADGEVTRVTQGIGLYGALPLPDALGPVAQMLGLGDEVQLSGKLPFGSAAAASGLELRLGLRLADSALPPVIHGAGLAVALDVGESGVGLRLQGDITFAFEQGLRGDAAATLADLGVDQIEPVTPDTECPFGGVVKYAVDGYYCHDLLTAAVGADLSFGPNGVSFTIDANLVSGRPGEPADGWRPFGIDWLVMRQLQAVIALEVGPTGPNVDFGVAANIDLAGKNLSGAISLGLRPLPALPFVAVDFNGIRAAAPNGVMLGDVVDVVNALSGGTGELADVGLPDIGLRNVSFSLSPLPQGVPVLCIAPGLRVQADLYVNPPATVTSEPTPTCDPASGIPVKPGPSTSCAQRRSEGCFAGILLDISNQGIIGQGSVAPFDIGPIKWKGGEIDLELTSNDQRLLVEGAGEISVGDAVLVEGELKLAFDDLNLTYYGALETFNGALNVLVDGEASIDVFNAENPAGLRLHVLVATSSAKIGDPSLGQEMIDSLTADLQRLNTLVDGLDQLIVQWENAGGRATQLLTELPVYLTNLGVDVPAWVKSFSAAMKHVEKTDVLDVVDNVFDAALNGATITIVPETCWGELGCTDPVTVTIPGLCDPVFPSAKGPNGRCTVAGIARAYITPVIRSAIVATVDGLNSLDGAALDRALKAAFDGVGKVVRLDCAEFETALGVGVTPRFALAVRGAVFGEPVGLTLDITPSDFQGLDGRIDEILTDVFRNMTEGQGLPECDGYRADLFGVGEADQEAPPIPVVTVVDDVVEEGSTATVRVQVTGYVPTERTLELAWGDGTTQTIVVGALPEQFTHVYTDDDPTGTNTDAKTVTVTDRQTARVASDTLAVVNVVPQVQAVFSQVIDEGDEATVTVTIDDPGADSHTVLVTWGDGSSDEVALGAGVKVGETVEIAHRFADDDPSGTKVDVVTAVVSVLDDDLGLADATADVTIRNVDPVISGISDVTLDEAGTVVLDVGVSDVGVLDTHAIAVDWGDGNVDPITSLQLTDGSGTHRTQHTYGDDGTFTITVYVADDDTAQVLDTVTATVRNVGPDAQISEPVDGTTWILADGVDTDAAVDVPTLLATSGAPTTLRTSADDPGSDDLTFTWSWGDGTSTATTSFVPGQTGADPDPSTQVIPRVAVPDAPAHTWSTPCLRRVDLAVADDDGGLVTDTTWVVVTGTARRQLGAGSWQATLQGKGPERPTADQVACYLAAVDHLSPVFGAAPDARPLATVTQAVDVLRPDGAGGDTAARLDRGLLVGWLELVRGGALWTDPVDLDGDRIADATYGALLRQAEAVRLDPTASRDAVQSMVRALATAVRA